jgi:8-oxo-dGTP pyrophosphatase MutT (NUDIX family)
MTPGAIRAIAICVFRDGDRVLLGEGYDTSKKQAFYRPLGGTIEFGERSIETVARELREEIGAEVVNLRYLGTNENIFTYEGNTGHEIVRIYEGDLADRSFYEVDSIDGHEDTPDGPLAFKAVWMPIAHFVEGLSPLYPDGLLELLGEHGWLDSRYNG